MRHPTDGTLRRLLDEPDGVADTDRDHIADCPVCQEGLDGARDDAAFAAAALDTTFEFARGRRHGLDPLLRRRTPPPDAR